MKRANHNVNIFVYVAV